MSPVEIRLDASKYVLEQYDKANEAFDGRLERISDAESPCLSFQTPFVGRGAPLGRKATWGRL